MTEEPIYLVHCWSHLPHQRCWKIGTSQAICRQLASPIYQVTEDRLLRIAGMDCGDLCSEMPHIYRLDLPSQMGEVGSVKPLGISAFYEEVGRYDSDLDDDLLDEMVSMQILLVCETRLCDSRLITTPIFYGEVNVWILIPCDVSGAAEIKRHVAEKMKQIPDGWELVHARHKTSDTKVVGIDHLARNQDEFVILLRKLLPLDEK